MLVEVCSNSLESAVNAEIAGANRIELCSELAVGGLTPSYGLLHNVRERLKIPIHVLIRPRSGDFTYSDSEFRVMLKDIDMCVKLGIDGVVCGVLNQDFSLDEHRLKELIEASGNLHFTFHRAFDWVLNPLEVLSKLEVLGVHTLLSSGQKKTAIDGLGLLIQLHNISTRLQVMPGSGINKDNAGIFKKSGFSALHLSGTTLVPNINNKQQVSMYSPNMLSDSKVLLTDIKKISSVVQKVK